METPGKNTVIAFVYEGQENEIYYIPQDFTELSQEAKGNPITIAFLNFYISTWKVNIL